MRYKLLKGQYYAPVGPPPSQEKTLHIAGVNDIITSDVDLIAKFPNKFEKIVEAIPVTVSKERMEAVEALIEEGVWEEGDREFLEQLSDENYVRVTRQVVAPAKKSAKASILGEDVTDDYPKAAEEGLKVFSNPSGKFQVTKATNTKKPLNKDPLEDKAGVEAFIDDYLKG